MAQRRATSRRLADAVPVAEGRIYGILAVAGVALWFLLSWTLNDIKAAPGNVKKELLPRIEAVEQDAKQHGGELIRIAGNAEHMREDIGEARKAAEDAARSAREVKELILQQQRQPQYYPQYHAPHPPGTPCPPGSLHPPDYK